jgi:hypothetical protein
MKEDERAGHLLADIPSLKKKPRGAVIGDRGSGLHGFKRISGEEKHFSDLLKYLEIIAGMLKIGTRKIPLLRGGFFCLKQPNFRSIESD